jgi:hypothetical protein
MKLFILLCLLNGFSAYSQGNEGSSLKMDGAYLMTKQVINNGFKDEILPTKQLKIYTDKYVMYAAPKSPTDSMASFGFGRYIIDKGKVVEYFSYIADAGELMDTAVLTITKLPRGYKQVIVYPPFKDTVYTLTEEYDKVDNGTVSALDGAWKQSKSYYISAKGDTTANHVTQYKVYYGGHFIWGAGFVDSASKKNQGVFGYGDFTLNGLNLVETNKNSTFVSDLVGIPVKIDIKLMGKDQYMQTIKNPKGEKTVEFYDRLK